MSVFVHNNNRSCSLSLAHSLVPSTDRPAGLKASERPKGGKRQVNKTPHYIRYIFRPLLPPSRLPARSIPLLFFFHPPSFSHPFVPLLLLQSFAWAAIAVQLSARGGRKILLKVDDGDDDGSGLASFNALVIIGPLTAKCLASAPSFVTLQRSSLFFSPSLPPYHPFPLVVPLGNFPRSSSYPLAEPFRVSVLVNWENNLLF